VGELPVQVTQLGWQSMQLGAVPKALEAHASHSVAEEHEAQAVGK
jgi:hypothetical protein